MLRRAGEERAFGATATSDFDNIDEHAMPLFVRPAGKREYYLRYIPWYVRNHWANWAIPWSIAVFGVKPTA